METKSITRLDQIFKFREPVGSIDHLSKNATSLLWNVSFQEYTCTHCQQIYSKELLGISLILYGSFYLVGKESGCWGINCVNCLKTLLFAGTKPQLEILRNNRLGSLFPPGADFEFSYCSSVNYYPAQFPVLKDFDIKCSGHYKKDHLVIDPRQPDHCKPDILDEVSGRPDLTEHYLCSYLAPNSNKLPYLGYLVTVWWFKENEIQKLVELENAKKIRIFQRCIISKFSEFESIERFCWKHKLYLEFLEKHRDIAEKINVEHDNSPYYTILESYINEDGDQEVIADNTPYYLHDIDQEIIKEKKRRISDLSVQFDFVNILLEPKPEWEILADDNTKQFIILNKDDSDKTFKWQQIAKSIKSKSISFFLQRDTDKWLKEHDYLNNILIHIKSNFTEKYVQEFLHENSQIFINNYISLAKSKAYSIAKLWQLKHDFSTRLYDLIIKNNKAKESPQPVQVTQYANPPQPSQDYLALKKEIDRYRSMFQSFRDIVSEDEKMLEILCKIANLASSGIIKNYLILGETGTGKELFANAIHEANGRKGKKPISVNCAALPDTLVESELFGYEKGAHGIVKERKPGKFEDADGGSIFLDEIGEFPLLQQSKILRTIGERTIDTLGGRGSKPIDFIAIFATNKDLSQEVKAGTFRKDLYQRIKPFTITLPPLRDRKGDIPLLIRHFIDKYDSEQDKPKIELADGCLEILIKYPWTGEDENVRALIGKIELIMASRKRGAIRNPIAISEFNLPADFLATTQPGALPGKSAATIRTAKHHTSAEALIAAYIKCDKNISRTTVSLGRKNRDNIRKRLIKLGVYEAPSSKR